MAESSDGRTEADTKMDHLFHFEVQITPKSKDKKKLDNVSLSTELWFLLNPKDLQKHLLQKSLLKNFVIKNICEPTGKSFAIIFAVSSEEDWNNFKKDYQNHLPLGIQSYLTQTKTNLSAVGLEITAKMTDSKTSKKAESFFKMRHDYSLDSGNDGQEVSTLYQPNAKTEKVMQREEDNGSQRHTKSITIGIYYPPSEVSKILQMRVVIGTTTVLLKSTKHNVWLGKCYLPADLNVFGYTVCIKYEIKEGFFSNITGGYIGSKIKEDIIHQNITNPFHIFEILFLKPYSKERANAYAEICSAVIMSTTERNLAENLETLQSFQFREKVLDINLKDIIVKVQEQIAGTCFGIHIFYTFLCFLANLQRTYHILPEKCVRLDLAKLIFQNCLGATMKHFPTSSSDQIPNVLMDLYVWSYKNIGSFLDFMFYTYPLITEELLLGLVRNTILKRQELKMFNKEYERESFQTQEILLRLTQRISESLSDRQGNALLALLLRHIPFQELLHFNKRLRSDTTTSNLASLCEETFISKVHVEIKSAKCLNELCTLWLEIRCFDFCQENMEAIIKKMETAVLNAIRNVSRKDRMGHFQTCLEDGDNMTIFQNTEQQTALLDLLVDSKNYELHKLSLFVLNAKRFQELAPEYGELALGTWFDTAKTHFCGKHVLAKSFIPKLYEFLKSAIVTKYVAKYTSIKEKLIAMVFLELHNYNMEDIIGNIEEIENLSDPDAEEMYREHVEYRLRKGHDDKTINVLIRDIRTKDILRINSRCSTLEDQIVFANPR